MPDDTDIAGEIEALTEAWDELDYVHPRISTGRSSLHEHDRDKLWLPIAGNIGSIKSTLVREIGTVYHDFLSICPETRADAGTMIGHIMQTVQTCKNVLCHLQPRLQSHEQTLEWRSSRAPLWGKESTAERSRLVAEIQILENIIYKKIADIAILRKAINLPNNESHPFALIGYMDTTPVAYCVTGKSPDRPSNSRIEAIGVSAAIKYSFHTVREMLKKIISHEIHHDRRKAFALEEAVTHRPLEIV